MLHYDSGRTFISFIPKTGRTHQLRVHSAHPLGLNAPIVGDESVSYTHLDVYKRQKEGRSMKRINQPYKWKAYRPTSRNPESGIPEDAF